MISTIKKNTAIDIVTQKEYIELKNWSTKALNSPSRQKDIINQLEKYFIKASEGGKTVRLITKNPIPKQLKVKLYKLADKYKVPLKIGE